MHVCPGFDMSSALIPLIRADDLYNLRNRDSKHAIMNARTVAAAACAFAIGMGAGLWLRALAAAIGKPVFLGSVDRFDFSDFYDSWEST